MNIGVFRKWLRNCFHKTRTYRSCSVGQNNEETVCHHFFDNADDFLFTLDLGGRFTSANRAGERITGYSSKELLSMTLPSLVAPEYSAINEEIWHKKLAGEKAPSYLVDILRKDGEYRPVEINIWMVCKSGQPSSIHGIARDSTARRQIEDALRNSERQYKELADSLPQSVYECDLEGRFTFINKASYKIFGYDLGDYTPEFNVMQMLHPDELERARTNLRLLFEGKIHGGHEYIARRKDGSCFPALIFPSLIYRDNRPVGFRGILIDLSEQRNLEAQLRQSQKMECVGQMAAGIAHDFNNILTIIHGHASMVSTREGLPPSLMDSLDHIVTASRRGTDLVRQLLAFGRKQTINYSMTDLNKVAIGSSTLLPQLLGGQISLKIQCAQRLPAIRADATMIEQVVMNLAINARDAMPSGGQLSISTAACLFDDHDHPEHPEAQNGRFVRLTVADNGCGMSKATLERVFEPFFTTKEQGKGSGLGLAMVYGIVKQHGGWIEVRSEINRGTSFDVYFPAYTSSTQTASVHEKGSEIQMVPGTGETILVVEDEPAVRQMMVGLLDTCGYRVVEASDGPEALDIWEREQGRIDLLLTDMVMPGGMSGRTLASRLRAINGDLKVVFTSGFSEEILNLPPDWLGDDLFISKPFHQSSLSRVVRKALDGQPLQTTPL